MYKNIFLSILLWGLSLMTISQTVSDSERAAIQNYIASLAIKEANVKGVKIISLRIKENNVTIQLSPAAAEIPFRTSFIDSVTAQVKRCIPSLNNNTRIKVLCDGRNIEEYIPNSFRSFPTDQKREWKIPVTKNPLVTSLATPYTINSGLQGRHIALWPGHGRYYDQGENRWTWQRARIFQTVEDLLTNSFVIPFLTPMLERAGANVLIPCERDANDIELIIDNDASPYIAGKYKEYSGDKIFVSSNDMGFAHKKEYYLTGENPFTQGTYRYTKTVRDGSLSTAEWRAQAPKEGNYAVYVAYKTVENSIPDAKYTIYHAGGKTSLLVNQQMGGGTWIYLGSYDFEIGDVVVTLSNKSNHPGGVVTADAVKIGGGMGNIARCSASTTDNPLQDISPTVSYTTRYAEGARYWMQWAGIPDSIYSKNKNENDYKDDYQSRSQWVNYIAGGSVILPKKTGLNIPIDLALAFHTDAGQRQGDSIVGTLAIYSAPKEQLFYANGVSRLAARDLSDMVQTQIVNDIRHIYDPNWQRRGLWNKKYSEAYWGEVPTMLLELLSHQNFNDMRYALDPQFRFTVGRSVYKGILKYIAAQNKMSYVVQPLPISHFNIQLLNDTTVRLGWQPVTDPLEPSAGARQYRIYTRIDGKGFDNGQLSPVDGCEITIQKGKLYSYKVTAVNDGGESMDSEILTAYSAPNSKGTILGVNAFTELSAPLTLCDSLNAGFKGIGVPYQCDRLYTGDQFEYKRNAAFINNDNSGHGASYANYESQYIAGNTFDYPYIHACAIAPLNYSFVSCSVDAITAGIIDMKQYPMVDLIMGLQRTNALENTLLQEYLAQYCTSGGNLFISGAYYASSLYHDNATRHKEFAQNTLHYDLRSRNATQQGVVNALPSASLFPKQITFNTQYNETIYPVESPDGIIPKGKGAQLLFRYADSQIGAGVIYNNRYRLVLLPFPFEAIITSDQRKEVMKAVIEFATK